MIVYSRRWLNQLRGVVVFHQIPPPQKKINWLVVFWETRRHDTRVNWIEDTSMRGKLIIWRVPLLSLIYVDSWLRVLLFEDKSRQLGSFYSSAFFRPFFPGFPRKCPVIKTRNILVISTNCFIWFWSPTEMTMAEVCTELGRGDHLGNVAPVRIDSSEMTKSCWSLDLYWTNRRTDWKGEWTSE